MACSSFKRVASSRLTAGRKSRIRPSRVYFSISSGVAVPALFLASKERRDSAAVDVEKVRKAVPRERPVEGSVTR